MKKIMMILSMMERIFLFMVLVLSLAFIPIGPNTEAASYKHHQSQHKGEGSQQTGDISHLEQWGPFETTVAYVAQFYPLWFTYYQSQIVPINRFAGPNRISPIYHIVVAINDDTLYASSLVDLSEQPVIVTIPETTATYSILTLDPYGNIFDTTLVAGTPETYALIGPGWKEPFPSGITPVEIPFNFFALIFRADKFSGTVNNTAEADSFRKSLQIATLSDYQDDSTTGATRIFPEIFFSPPFKTAADSLATYAPIVFLKQLQVAVGSTNTPPLSPYEKLLTQRFDSLFGDGEFTDGGGVGQLEKAEFAAGTRRAHQLIVNRYLNHTGPTNWINFTNIGAWGSNVIERASITEFIQYGNGHNTAAYYHAFKDGSGIPLSGDTRYSGGYVLTFPADQVPDAERFWSVTAYTPDAIELVFNTEEKYEVASYTPGLEKNWDKSISIYMSPKRPQRVPLANWLPVPTGPFNIMLRVYGPKGKVADGTYIPPAIERLYTHGMR